MRVWIIVALYISTIPTIFTIVTHTTNQSINQPIVPTFVTSFSFFLAIDETFDRGKDNKRRCKEKSLFDQTAREEEQAARRREEELSIIQRANRVPEVT